MSGGVALIDFDRDGWPDIYFTNAPKASKWPVPDRKARRARLYRNNHERHIYRMSTDKARRSVFPCWAMGAAVGRLQQ